MKPLLWLYPKAWRERYGEEFAALLADHPVTLSIIADVFRAALEVRRTAMRTKLESRLEALTAHALFTSTSLITFLLVCKAMQVMPRHMPW